ncbi:MAG: LysR family nitrogen assimilation transcriptional regulator, partial [Paracoccaceae bacterium]
MDIKQLRHFLAIVEEGSFSRAALRIGVAQPALSLRVRKMEEALGTPLLLRSAGGVTPTEAGELLARRARTLLADLDRTEEEIRSLGAEPSGKVRIGLPGTISGIVSVPLIALMRARHPRIRLNIAEAMSGFVAEWLRDGRIDLA